MLQQEPHPSGDKEEHHDHRPGAAQVPPGDLAVRTDELVALDIGGNLEVVVERRTSRARGIGRGRTDGGDPWPRW